MTLFEFILVLVSLILAIGVTQLLRGVANVVRYRDELKLSWVPLCWAGTLFLLTAAHWWSLWDMRDTAWTFPTFFFLLLPPTLQYFAISLLVSWKLDSERASLQDEFQRIRVPFLGAVLLWTLIVMWDGAILGAEAIWNYLRANQSLGAVMLALGMFSPRWGIQKLVAVGMLLSASIGSFLLRFLPGIVF